METFEQGRISPNDLKAETSVLSLMILDREALDTASGLLKAEDFYKATHGEIFKSIINLSLKEEVIDYITLSTELQEQGKLDMIGGVEYLIELSNEIVGLSNIEAYCQIVKDKASLRNLIRISDEIMEKSYSGKPVEEVLEYAETSVYNLSQDKVHSDLEHMSSIVMDTMQQIEEISLNPDSLTGITTGLSDLNRNLSGFQKSDLVLLAARPSMGKTALALNMALSAALEKKNVAVFSLEMSKAQLTQRLLASVSMLNLGDIISGNIEDWSRLAQAMSILSTTDMYVDDTSGISLTELRSKCRKLSAKKGLDIVFIDYLQLMTSDVGENRQQEISAISRGLKGLAKDLNCPVVALSQLSRAPELRSDHRPIMSDLRESGAIEQDADVVMLLYRDDYYNEDSEKPDTAELIIAKHRNGPTGTVDLFFNKQYTKFTDLVTDRDNEIYG